jgi:hypothetical protein
MALRPVLNYRPVGCATHKPIIGVKRFAPAPIFSATLARTLAAALASAPSHRAHLRSTALTSATPRRARLCFEPPRSPPLHCPRLRYAAPRMPVEEPSVEEPRRRRRSPSVEEPPRRRRRSPSVEEPPRRRSRSLSSPTSPSTPTSPSSPLPLFPPQ